MNTSDVQAHLRSLGWPIAVDGSYGPNTFNAVGDFQAAFAFYDLLIDHQAGPATQQALASTLANGGKACAHFALREFKSKGNGWIKVSRVLLRGLDIYRDRYGPTFIVSAYRDPIHNRREGGATNSQHLYGGAVDIPPVASLDAVRNLRLFSGIGYDSDTRLVRHVDVRGQGGIPATTIGTRLSPMTWDYPA